MGGIVFAFAALSVCVGADASVGADAASTTVLDRAVTATHPAVRGEQHRVRPLPPQVTWLAVIGDSLMDNARTHLRNGLDRTGVESVIDAQPSRRIPASVTAPYSGVTAARQVRETWGDADCWVIALGSNDLIYGAGNPTTAAAMIESMLAVVTPGSRVWWVNVDYHLDPRYSFDFVAASARFNEQLALAERAGALTVIDWYSLAEAHPDWFFDPVHVNISAASKARAQQVVDAIVG